MRDPKEKLMDIILLDIRHCSVEALKEALLFADDKCLGPSTVDDLRFWWTLRKAIQLQLDLKRMAQRI